MQMISLPHWLQALTSESWPFKSALWAQCPQRLVLSTEAPGPAQWGLQSLGKLCLPGSDTDHIVFTIPQVSIYLGPTWVPSLSPTASSSVTCCLLSVVYFQESSHFCPLSHSHPGWLYVPYCHHVRKINNPPHLSLHSVLSGHLSHCFTISSLPRILPSVCVFVPTTPVLSRVRGSVDRATTLPWDRKRQGLVLLLTNLGRA